MDMERRRVWLNDAGVVVAEETGFGRVLLLPRGMDVEASLFREVLEISRNCGVFPRVDYAQADYLPGYRLKLISDLEASVGEGNSVYLWGPAQDLVLIGYPRVPAPPEYCWTDLLRWYLSAQDALNQANSCVLE